MHFKPAQCPSCGGSLQLPDDRTTVNCMYCGATVVVREAIQAVATAMVPNLLKLARAAAHSSNHQEAYDYFTRVLEIDGNNSEAWTGKAEAAGRMSGQHSFRMPEMINYFRNAIGVASDDQRAQIQDEAAQVICRIISEDYQKMRSALSPSFWDNSTWIFYLNRVQELIKLLEDANKLIPHNNSILRAIIWLCDDNSNRLYFRDKLGQRTRREFDSRWNALIKDKKRKYTEELQALNRPLTLPPITKNIPYSAAATVSTSSTAGTPINRNVVLIGLGAVLVIGVLLILVVIAVNIGNKPSGTTVDKRPAPSVTPTKPTSTGENPAAKRITPSPTTPNFATSIVCSLPAQAFSNTPFGTLGGGQWRKWIDSGGELDYACEGGTDLIKLKHDGNVDITAEYSVLGNSQSAHYISAEYTAFQYTGQTVDEMTLRQQYAAFCDRLASKLYGKKLSKAFRNRILNESTYSPTGTANSHAERIGTGYVSLSSNQNNAMLMLNVHFFPSEADYRNYKDS